MWFILALSSALLLGFYDVFKKQSLRDNSVIVVLFINTLISTLVFMPEVIASATGLMSAGSRLFVASGSSSDHAWVMLKAVIVLSSWICGYFAIKHLPLTIVGPINATRPVMTLVGALLIFGERLNPWQWAGVIVAIVAFLLLSRSGKREGIDFVHDRWILLLVAAAAFGACSGLYDKFLLAPVENGGLGLAPMFVQSWFNIYQMIIMGIVLLAFWRSGMVGRFQWRWTILGISLFLCAADACYFSALSHDGALIAVVSMTRRSSVLVSFLFGALLLKEKNIGSKAFDLVLIFISLILLCLGAR